MNWDEKECIVCQGLLSDWKEQQVRPEQILGAILTPHITKPAHEVGQATVKNAPFEVDFLHHFSNNDTFEFDDRSCSLKTGGARGALR